LFLLLLVTTAAATACHCWSPLPLLVAAATVATTVAG
jgi:hypothetical protein